MPKQVEASVTYALGSWEQINTWFCFDYGVAMVLANQAKDGNEALVLDLLRELSSFNSCIEGSFKPSNRWDYTDFMTRWHEHGLQSLPVTEIEGLGVNFQSQYEGTHAYFLFPYWNPVHVQVATGR